MNSLSTILSEVNDGCPKILQADRLVGNEAEGNGDERDGNVEDFRVNGGEWLDKVLIESYHECDAHGDDDFVACEEVHMISLSYL